MKKPSVGDRVGALLSIDQEKKTVHLLGFGVYDGDHVPDERATGSLADGAREAGRLNPRLRLDDGNIVFGCECYWSSAATIRTELDKYLSKGFTINRVDIGAAREEARLTSANEDGPTSAREEESGYFDQEILDKKFDDVYDRAHQLGAKLIDFMRSQDSSQLEGFLAMGRLCVIIGQRSATDRDHFLSMMGALWDTEEENRGRPVHQDDGQV